MASVTCLFKAVRWVDTTDDLQSLFYCKQLRASQNVKFDAIYSNDMNKVAITLKEFRRLWQIRKKKIL